MDDKPSDKSRPKPDLAAALRTARADDADRTEALHDLRTVALARLGLLRDALHPILAQLPDDADLFDVGLMPSDPPRLFVDMIAFVEMARDRRSYRLYQDRRDGRVLLAECDTLDGAVDAVTAYFARRLIEREKALAAEAAISFPQPTPKAPAKTAAVRRPWPLFPKTRSASDVRYWLGQVFWFLVEVVGLLAMLGLLVLGLRSAWTLLRGL